MIRLRERAAAPARAEEGREPAAAPPHLTRPKEISSRAAAGWPAAGKKSNTGEAQGTACQVSEAPKRWLPSLRSPTKLATEVAAPPSGKACFGAARTERCARVCGSDAEASSTGNARRRARARACVGGDGNGIGCEEGMPREEGKGSDPRQGRGSGYSTSSPGSWRHKDEHLPGTHRKVVGDCNSKMRTAKEVSSSTSLDGS